MSSYNDDIAALGVPTQSVTEIALDALAVEGFTTGSIADRQYARAASLAVGDPEASINDMMVNELGVPVGRTVYNPSEI